MLPELTGCSSRLWLWLLLVLFIPRAFYCTAYIGWVAFRLKKGNADRIGYEEGKFTYLPR